MGYSQPLGGFDIVLTTSESGMFFYIDLDVQITTCSTLALITLCYYLWACTFYLKVIFYPFEIPAGISKVSYTFDTFIPVALQSPQGCLITIPIPLHLEHYKCITIDYCLYIVVPEPPQARQRVGAVPGWHRFPLQLLHVSLRSNYSLMLVPLTESMKFMDIYLLMSSPFLLRVEPVLYVS